MRIPRIYCAQRLCSEATITLSTNASKHLLHVLRLKLGGKIILFDGLGGEYNASLVAVKSSKAIVKTGSFVETKVESPLKIYVAQSLIRSEKMDYIIQKSVELGVHKIIPLLTERSKVTIPVAKLRQRKQRWQTIVINACEQSGRTYVPVVEEAQLFTTWIAAPHAGQGIILDTEATQNLQQLPASQTITILIGPEGGFTAQEINLARQYKFSAIKLGPRILRTETASLAMISALQLKFGDFF